MIWAIPKRKGDLFYEWFPQWADQAYPKFPCQTESNSAVMKLQFSNFVFGSRFKLRNVAVDIG